MVNFYDKFKKSFFGVFFGAGLSVMSLCVQAQELTWREYMDNASTKNPTGAIQDLEKANKIAGHTMEKEDKIVLLKRLSNAYASANNLDKAIFYSDQLCDLLEMLIAQKQDSKDLKSEYIKTLIQTADWQRFNTQLDEAHTNYWKAHRLSGTNVNAVTGLIFTHYLLENYEMAQRYINVLNKIDKNSPITTAFNAYAQINVNATLIKQVEIDNPTDLQILLIVAAAYVKKNDLKTALQKYDKVIKIINEQQKEKDGKENKDQKEKANIKVLNKYLKNFAFLEKASIYMVQKDFLHAGNEYSNLVQNGVKTLFVNFARFIAQKEHVITHQKMYQFSAEEGRKLIEAQNLKSTKNYYQVDKMTTFAIKHCSGIYDQNDPSNVWTHLLTLSTQVSKQYPNREESQLNHIKLLIKIGQTAKAKTKLEECFEKIKKDELKAKNEKLKAKNNDEKNNEVTNNDTATKVWNIEKFNALKQEMEVIINDQEAPRVYIMSPQFPESLARGGGEKELSEEKFDILFNVTDNIGVEKITVNGQQQNFTKSKEVIFNFKARFTVEPGIKQMFVIDAYDKAGNHKSQQLEIRRKIKEELHTLKAPEKLQNKTLDHKLIGKQYLVLIGTDEYKNWTPLNNAVLDMKTLHKTLKEKYKVDSVIMVYNGTKKEIMNMLHKIVSIKFGEYDQMLIAVAGHGDFVNYDNTSNGRGVIVPKDALPKDEDISRSSYISYPDFKDVVKNIPCKKVMVLLDVCFAGTIDERLATRGLPEMKLSDNEKANEFLKENNKKDYNIVITSGGKESVYDGKAGENSPFMKEVIKSLEREGNIFGVLTGDEFWNNIVEEQMKSESFLKTTPHISNIKEINPKQLGTFLFFKK